MGEALLIVVAHQVPDLTSVAVKVLAGVALFELAIRRPLRHALAVAAVHCAVYFAVVPYELTLPGVLGVWYRLVVVVGAPVLVGAYLRSSVQAVSQARARAADAEERVRCPSNPPISDQRSTERRATG